MGILRDFFQLSAHARIAATAFAIAEGASPLSAA